MTDGTTKQWTAFGAMAEVAATMMKAAFSLPIAALRTACNLQDKAIGVMEGFVPGAAPDARQSSGSASAAPGPAPAASTGWGPVTRQNPGTGWGPMPHA